MPFEDFQNTSYALDTWTSQNYKFKLSQNQSQIEKEFKTQNTNEQNNIFSLKTQFQTQKDQLPLLNPQELLTYQNDIISSNNTTPNKNSSTACTTNSNHNQDSQNKSSCFKIEFQNSRQNDEDEYNFDSCEDIDKISTVSPIEYEDLKRMKFLMHAREMILYELWLKEADPKKKKAMALKNDNQKIPMTRKKFQDFVKIKYKVDKKDFEFFLQLLCSEIYAQLEFEFKQIKEIEEEIKQQNKRQKPRLDPYEYFQKSQEYIQDRKAVEIQLQKIKKKIQDFNKIYQKKDSQKINQPKNQNTQQNIDNQIQPNKKKQYKKKNLSDPLQILRKDIVNYRASEGNCKTACLDRVNKKKMKCEKSNSQLFIDQVNSTNKKFNKSFERPNSMEKRSLKMKVYQNKGTSQQQQTQLFIFSTERKQTV